MKALSKLFRKTDSTWVRPWEDRDTPDFKKWSSTSLAWAIYVNNKPHGNVRKFWNQTLNHRTIALLAINARFNNLPDFVVVHCNRKHLMLNSSLTFRLNYSLTFRVYYAPYFMVI